MVSGNTFGATQDDAGTIMRYSGLFHLIDVFLGQFTKCQKIEFGKLGAIGSFIDVINMICFKLVTRKSNGKIIWEEKCA